MVDSPPPEQQLVEKVRRFPRLDEYDLALVSVPLVYVAGVLVRYFFAVDVRLSMGGASAVAAGVLADVLSPK